MVDDDYAPSEFPTNTALENLQVTVAHEYFHAVQFGYDIADDSWFLEATAAWVEDEMYDNVNDNLQYLRQSPLRLPRVPMDTFGGSFHYGTWIFFRYLSERYPASRAGCRRSSATWSGRCDSSAGKPDQYSIQAVKTVLKERGTELPELFAKFSAANRRPAQTYSEGKANHYGPRRWPRSTHGPRADARRLTSRLDHLTSAHGAVHPAKALKGKNVKLRILLTMAQGQARLGRGRQRQAQVRQGAGRSRSRSRPRAPA